MLQEWVRISGRDIIEQAEREQGKITPERPRTFRGLDERDTVHARNRRKLEKQERRKSQQEEEEKNQKPQEIAIRESRLSPAYKKLLSDFPKYHFICPLSSIFYSHLFRYRFM